MMRPDKSKRKRKNTSIYEVDGVTSIPLERCIWHLERMGYPPDDKLLFSRWVQWSDILVSGFLAPRDVGLTQVKADVQVMLYYEVNRIAVVFFFFCIYVGPLIVVPRESIFYSALYAFTMFFLVVMGVVVEYYAKRRAAHRKAVRARQELYQRLELR